MYVQEQVPRAKRPVRAPETTPASSLGGCSATLRSSSASSSGAGAGASATSIVVATRPPRRRGGEQCDKLPRHVVERRLFLAPWLVWRGRGGARGSPGEEGERPKGFGFSGRLVKSYLFGRFLFVVSVDFHWPLLYLEGWCLVRGFCTEAGRII